MFSKNYWAGLIAGIFLLPNFAYADSIKFPNLCNADEFVVLSAAMESLDKNRNSQKNGKLVSLCTDKKNGKVQKFVYRYGKPGAVEMEQYASPSNKFHEATVEIAPSMVYDVIWFQKGSFNYYVCAGGGRIQGISVRVFNSGKKIFDQFSGSSWNEDFYQGDAYVDSKLNKDLISAKDPLDKLW